MPQSRPESRGESVLAPITSACIKPLFGWLYLDAAGDRHRAGQRLPSRPWDWLVCILVESRATQKLHPSALAPAHGPERNTIAGENSPYLHRYYERIRTRRGTGKAIIALARKFLSIIYHTLKKNWIFEDFPNFVLAEAKA